VKYPIVNGMAKAYPELQPLQDYYMRDMSAKEADGLLKYFSVLTDRENKERTIKGRENLALKASPGIEIIVNGSREQGEAKYSNKYNEYLTSWFKIVYDIKLSIWFGLKTALHNQVNYLLQPLDQTDVNREAEGRKKIAKEIEDLQARVERMERDLFNPEQKKIVNETLEKHSFAGYSELFAINRN